MSQDQNHPISDDALRRFKPMFDLALTHRLYEGARQYGDGSFERTPAELLRELSEECLDLAGWGFILWTKIQKMLVELEQH